ncbi:hypothetical protein [Dyadobacter sp. CY323]|uniref:hypothetical protein n=1 Tax=Dyadobacter sp. CY323 TaxID=2907302 RepID=UPI001F38A3FD|nr:hypothetical protein [Dyadobacter sp. CY323]MCE6989832.1 hypothetical protein [Dyadobacter sp. CY323]
MTARRTFVKQICAAGALSTIPGFLHAQPKPEDKKIWAGLLHLSFNMWEEYISPHRPFRGYRPDLRLSEPLWNEALERMAKSGMNMVVIDLGDAVKYESHPEISVHNAWSPDRLRQELTKMRALGLEPIPKLNFSAGHDTWMGPYARMVSTQPYYTFCRNIIAEVIDIFDKPRFFHLGMDEETASHQHYYLHTVVRKNDVWWGDFYYLIGEVQKGGARPWIWSDYMWDNLDLFLKKMPKSVVQSNWYYGESFALKSAKNAKNLKENPQTAAIKRDSNRAASYIDLEKNGYDQIPTGSFHDNNTHSIGNTVKFCTEQVADTRLLGFLQTFWKPTIEEYRNLILTGIDLTADSKKWFDKNRK